MVKIQCELAPAKYRNSHTFMQKWVNMTAANVDMDILQYSHWLKFVVTRGRRCFDKKMEQCFYDAANPVCVAWERIASADDVNSQVRQSSPLFAKKHKNVIKNLDIKGFSWCFVFV